MAGPPWCIYVGWVRVGDRDWRRGREAAEADKSSRARKKTRVSPEGPHSLPSKAGTWGKLSSVESSYRGVLYTVNGSFSNTTVVGSILEGTERTQNNTKQVSLIIALTIAVQADTGSRKESAVISYSPRLSPLQ